MPKIGLEVPNSRLAPFQWAVPKDPVDCSPPKLPICAGRLGRDVLDHPVDASDLVDDAGCRLAEELVVEVETVRRHAVGGGDSAQGATIVVGPGITQIAYDTFGAKPNVVGRQFGRVLMGRTGCCPRANGLACSGLDLRTIGAASDGTYDRTVPV